MAGTARLPRVVFRRAASQSKYHTGECAAYCVAHCDYA